VYLTQFTMKKKTLINEISRTLSEIEGVGKLVEKKSIQKKIKQLAKDLKERIKKQPKKKKKQDLPAPRPPEALAAKVKPEPKPKASTGTAAKRVPRKVTPKQEIKEADKA
jgi:hypothetical protein